MIILNFLIYFLYLFPSNINGLDSFTETSCGQSKSCYRWSSCSLPSCDFGFTWSSFKDNGKDYLEIELVGRLEKGSNEYVAVGFSDDEKMGQDGVVGCYLFNSSTGISVGSNPDYFNTLINEILLDQNFLMISKGSRYGAEYDAGSKTLRCRFARSMQATLKTNEVKDLSNSKKFYIQSAIGTMTTWTRFDKHYSTKRSSSETYNFSSSTYVNRIETTQSVNSLIKLHGCLMIIGWIILLTNGIILAKFYKNNWSTNKWCNKAIWFQMHLILQSSGVILVCAAFIIIFVNYKGLTNVSGSPIKSAHQVIGLLAVSFMLLNPFMALCRCTPTHPKRIYFNILHSIVGLIAYNLAGVNIIIGMQLTSSGPQLYQLQFPWIIALVFLILFEVILIYGVCVMHWNCLKTIKMESDLNGVKKTHGLEILIISVIISLTFGIVLVALVVAY